ncbi:MAG TPA: efflux RND transporter periplasmic adaptor subunit [Thermoanaerobaculia bacterium]|nr:efflux RND transporter periplasmic adaptor subunit [Thermoanaerobaculia bacterium]
MRDRLELATGPLGIRHLLTGELEAAEAVQFITPNVGMWPLQVQRLLPNGARVRAGEIVVEFDNSNLLTTLDNQQGTVIRAQADLEATRSLQAEQVREKELALEQRKAEAEKARISASLPPGLKADIEYEKLQLELRRAELAEEEARASLGSTREAARAEIGIKEVELERAWQDLRHAEHSLEQVVLRAPEDGILVVHNNRQLDRTFQSSDAAQPGEAVASLPDLETLRVRARLFDVDEGDLRTGAPVSITLDAYSERRFEGVIREVQKIAQQPSRRSSRRTFDVLVELGAIDLDLMLPGMSAKITVEETVSADEHGCEPLLAPRRALSIRGDLLGAPAGGELAATDSTGSKGSTGLKGSVPLHRALLHLADGSTREVDVDRCNVTHCIVAHGEGASVLEPGTRLQARPGTES